MLVVFSSVFVADTNIIIVHNFVAPLILTTFLVLPANRPIIRHVYCKILKCVNYLELFNVIAMRS